MIVLIYELKLAPGMPSTRVAVHVSEVAHLAQHFGTTTDLVTKSGTVLHVDAPLKEVVQDYEYGLRDYYRSLTDD